MEQNKKTGAVSRLWSLSRGSRLLYLCAFVFMVLTVITNFLLPQVIRYVVDNVIGGAQETDIPFVSTLIDWIGGNEVLKQNLWLILILGGALGLAYGLFNLCYRGSLAMGAEGMIKRLRDNLFTHIQHLPYSWHVEIQTGDIIQRCTSDVDVVRNFITNQILDMVRTVILVTLGYTLLFPMNFPMALASFAFLPVIFIYSFVFLSRVSKRFMDADMAEGQLMSIAQENFNGVRVVRAFGRERHEVDRFDKQNHHFANLWMRLGELLSTYWGLGDFVTGLQFVTICAVGVWQAYLGNISAGTFIVFVMYNQMTIWPVRGLGRTLSEASKTGVSLTRLGEILDAPLETDLPDACEEPVRGDIVFDSVSFSYEDQQVLDNVSFTIPEGTTVGILGSTGSGKTTLMHLLCRLYDRKEDESAISIGGRPIEAYKRRWLRKNIGIVLQEPFLYSRTISENIAALSKEHSMEAIRGAATVSCVDDAIQEFALGYDTIVGERGVTLSGGQKQRVAIARTILPAPPIMIFDDSLSAVDTETDARIRNALSKRTENATTVIIAHRITSISKADLIVVMDGGRVVEMGTHEELLNLGGVYARTYEMQESIEEELA